MSIEDVVRRTIAAHPDLADGTRRRVPTAWGHLAAQAVIAFRDTTGRPPSDMERREIWQQLWAAAHAREV